MTEQEQVPKGELCISCYRPATWLVVMHERPAGGGTRDLEAWACDEHRKPLEDGGITF
jgi:hypothetical protein